MAAELVTLEKFDFLADAEAARDLLEGQGIPAFLFDARTIQTDWLLGNAIGYIKVQVPSDQLEVARSALVSQQEIRSERSRSPHDPGAIACLACADIPRDRQDCPSCGWCYDDGSERRAAESLADSDEADEEDQPSSLDRFRGMKRRRVLVHADSDRRGAGDPGRLPLRLDCANLHLSVILIKRRYLTYRQSCL